MCDLLLTCASSGRPLPFALLQVTAVQQGLVRSSLTFNPWAYLAYQKGSTLAPVLTNGSMNGSAAIKNVTYSQGYYYGTNLAQLQQRWCVPLTPDNSSDPGKRRRELCSLACMQSGQHKLTLLTCKQASWCHFQPLAPLPISSA